jgi:membrane fusion protein (multidrug efflux system)
VAAGEPLYQIDAAPFRAVLASAEAALGRAESNLAVAKLRAGRFQQALAAKGVSQQEADDAAAVLAQAEADLRYHQALADTARINLGYARVTSPIAGRIGASSVTDGAIVTAYQPVPLAVIQQLDPIYVDVPQSATELLRLRRKLGGGRAGEPGGGRVAGEGGGLGEVRLLLPDGTGYGHAGALQFRDVSVDPTTGTVTLRMVFPNPDKVLLPGMFVRAVVPEGEDERAILIPQQTVARTPKGEPLAWLVGAGGKVEVRKLTLERAIGDRWLVSGGLAPGERIIAEGVQKVRPGMVVKEVPFEEPVAGNGGTAEQAAAAN